MPRLADPEKDFGPRGKIFAGVNLFFGVGTKVDMDDQTLIEALRRKDLTAASDWISRDGDRLLRSAFLLCGNEADAQDLAQETFLQALKSVDRFRGQSSLYTWLHGILLNLSRHYHRERKRLVLDEELAGVRLGATEEAALPMEEETARLALGRAMRELSEPHKEVIILRFFEDLKLAEIALRLGVSKGTVKSRLHYALARMQELLPPEMNLFSAGGTERKDRK